MQYYMIETMPFGENAYILYEEKHNLASVIDPGGSLDKIISFLEKKNLKLKSIILTHSHIDHIAGLQDLIEKFEGIEVVASKKEKKILNNPAYNLTMKYGFNYSFEATKYVEDEEEYQFGDEKLKFIVTPGHTAGSMCILAGDFMFTGDTLFEGSIGRTDLPSGSYNDMILSLSRLSKMDEELVILPGHGNASTIGREKKYNPFLRELR